MRTVVSNANRTDGMLAARTRVASGITPGCLPRAVGSDDLPSRVRECKMVEGWGDKMMNVLLDMSCGALRTPGLMVLSWTPCNGFRTLFSTWATHRITKSKFCMWLHCGLPLNTKVAYKSMYVLVGLLCEMNACGQGDVTPSLMMNEDSWT